MKRARLVLSLLAAVLAPIVIAVAARAPLASYLAEAWLASKGVPSSIHVDELSADRVKAHLTLGAGLIPDFSGRVTLLLTWNGLTPGIAMARISEPRLVATFDGKTISIGALGKLIDALKSPTPAPPSTISATVEHAIVHIAAPQGSLDIAANAEVRRGKLIAFDASSRGGDLTADGTRITITKARLSGRGEGEIFALQGAVNGAAARAGFAAKQIAIRFASPAMRLGQDKTSYGLFGRFHGTAQIGGAAITRPGGAARVTALAAVFSGVVQGGALTLQTSLDGKGRVDAGAARAEALHTPIFGADESNVRALTAALAQVTIHADDLRISYRDAATHLSLPHPLAVTGSNGAVLRLDKAEVTAAAQQTHGSGTLSLQGGGLPDIALDLASFHLTPQAMDADFRLHAKLNALPYRGLEISGGGAFHASGADYRMRLGDCAQLRLASYLSRGKPMLTNFSGKICPDKDIAFRGDAKGWTFAARWNAATGKLIAAQSVFARGNGRIALSGTAAGLRNGQVTVNEVAVSDGAKAPRFSHLDLSGALALKDQDWDGTIRAAAKGRKLGTAVIHHAMATGAGSARIAANLVFAGKGLQPADLSPLLSGFSQTSGNAAFDGKLDWNKRGMTSRGALTLSHLDFIGPGGPVNGANGKIAFTSLAPLKSAPDQAVTLDKIGWVVPATNIAARFKIDGNRVSLRTLTASIAGGTISLDPAIADLSNGLRIESTVHFKNVDLDALAAATNFADRIKLEVRVSGAVPFSIGPDGIRLTNGTLSSDAAGRLSISRSLWSSGTSVETTDAIRDFAYQAMEHLALDSLDGVLTSLPTGRLGLKLHIKGHNDPQNDQPPTTVGLIDLIRGNAFNKPIPLPKNTPVDLTLDTSLNFDELLRAYGQLRRGADVQ